MDSTIQDTALAKKIQQRTTALRELIDAVGDRRIRQHMDELLCRVYLLARDGHTRNLNGGAGGAVGKVDELHTLVSEALTEYSIGYVLGTDWVERARSALQPADAEGAGPTT